MRYPEVPRSHLDVVLVLFVRDWKVEARSKFSVTNVVVILNQWGGVKPLQRLANQTLNTRTPRNLRCVCTV